MCRESEGIVRVLEGRSRSETRRPEWRWQHVNGSEGGTNGSCRGVKCEVRTRGDQPGAWVGIGALMEVTGPEGLRGEAQAEGARPRNLRAMMGLGLMSWGSVWGHGTDCKPVCDIIFTYP